MLVNLKLLLNYHDITTGYLSESTGINQRTIQLYLKQSVAPSLKNAILIADHFNVTLDFLCGRSTDNRADSDYILR